jgi:tetrahydromethanopterin S-methyltransferase subunit G
MERQNNEDTKQNTKDVNWWTDKTIKIKNRIKNWHLWYSVWYLYCFVGPSIDRFGILFGIFIVLSVHQLTPLVSCLVSLLFCRFINWQLWYHVWYLHCFVGPSIDSFGILFGIFIVLSVHQLTALVSCLVSLLLCRSINWPLWWYQKLSIDDRQYNEDTKQDTKAVNWWIDKTIKIPNRIPKLSIDGATKQWRYQTGYQSCQLMDRQSNEDTKQDTKVVHQLTALVSCLVSSLFCRSINWQL